MAVTASLKTIAAEAGVSVATVSRAFTRPVRSASSALSRSACSSVSISSTA